MHSDFFFGIKTPGAQSTERKLGSITELRGGGKGTEIQPEIAVPLLLSELWVPATCIPYPGVSPASSSWFPTQRDGSAQLRFLSS